MYPKYNTKSILIHSYLLAEDDRAFVLYTERFGLLHARAFSIRKEKAKLKGMLSAYLELDLTLIRGKAGWRIIELSGARCALRYIESSKLRDFFKLLKFLLANSPKEEQSERLFDSLSSALSLLKMLSGKDRSAFYNALLYDILSALGYAERDFQFFSAGKFQRDLYDLQKPKILERINKAKARSHLHF